LRGTTTWAMSPYSNNSPDMSEKINKKIIIDNKLNIHCCFSFVSVS